jgi:hypothetical protein
MAKTAQAMTPPNPPDEPARDGSSGGKPEVWVRSFYAVTFAVGMLIGMAIAVYWPP